MSKIKVTFVETNCKKNGPIKQTLNIIRNMDKEVFEPSLVTVWPEDADNSMIDEYKKLDIPVLSANMSKKKSVLFGKKAVGQLLEQLQPDIVQGVGMPPYRMTLGYKRAIHFVTLRNYCYEDYPDYYGKIPGTVMAFLDLNLIKKRMAAGEPFVTCSESLTKMYRSRQNMEIPYIRNGVDVSQYTKRNCDEIDDVRRKLDLPLGKVIYVYSGGFIDRKNQREAITAFLAMKKNADAVLLLLGDGTNFEALKDEFSKNVNKKGIKYFILVAAAVYWAYGYGLLDTVIGRFLDGFKSGDLTTGRNTALSLLMRNGYLNFNFLMGHAGADLSERMIAALEYPPLRWAYLFGVWFSVVMCIILFLTPAIKILKNKNIKIFIVLIILILDVNSYNGITTQSDQMLLYCVSVFLLLNLSYAVRGNENEDMCSGTKSIYTRRYPTSCNYNYK